MSTTLRIVSRGERLPEPRPFPVRPPRVPEALRKRMKDSTPVWVISDRCTGAIKCVCREQTRAGATRELLALGLARTHRADIW